jgi:ATP-dependent protease ClpP protease subunit
MDMQFAAPIRLEEKQAVPAATPTNNAVAPALTVEAVANHVYFYSEVNTDRCLALMQKIREQDNTLRWERESRGLPDDFPKTPIWLHIHSYGGDLFAGLNMADQLKSIRTPIYSVIEGCCASAATLISMPCTRRFIRPSSYMLVHQFSSFVFGKYQEFKDDMRLQDMLMDRLAGFYVKHSKLKDKAVRKMLKHDYWLDADEALNAGFVDEIV